MSISRRIQENKANLARVQAQYEAAKDACKHVDDRGNSTIKIKDNGTVAYCTECETVFGLQIVTKEHADSAYAVYNDMVQQIKITADVNPTDATVVENIGELLHNLKALPKLYERYCTENKNKKKKKKRHDGGGQQNYGIGFLTK